MKHHMSFTPVGVRILVEVSEKYLFRSLLTAVENTFLRVVYKKLKENIL